MTDEIFVVTMPKLGETVTEGTIGSWLKQVGDTVEFDDPLFEVSTDKVDSEIPSPHDGVVLEILVGEGETVPVGTELVRIGPEGASTGSASGSGGSTDKASTGSANGSGGSTDEASTGSADEGTPPGESAGMAEGAGIVHDLTMPKLGETVTEGTIGSWLKQVGDTVEFDDPLYEVSTDKVDSEIPSPHDGVLLEILVAEGETAPVGTVIARIGEAGSEPSGSGEVAPAPAHGEKGPTRSSPAGASAGPGASPGKNLSPLVRRLAAEHGIDLADISGSGEGGRIRREDVQAAISAGGGKPSSGRTPNPAAPAKPSAAATQAPAAAAAAPMGPDAGAPAVPGVPDNRDEVVTLSKMRLAIAAGMVRSLQTAPQVWTSIEVDYENVEKCRRAHKEAYKKATGASLSYLTFVASATCDALLEFPAVNSSIDVPNKQQTLHPYVNLGIAVDLDEQGLIVPVVRDADQLNLKGVGSQIKKQAELGRAGKLGMDEMRGSTFTITNVGPYQSYASAPIINQPNVAIMCLDGVARKPVAVGDMIAIHPVGIIGLVYDHRAFDGATASKFLLRVRDILQTRDWGADLA
ncbi:2-oxoglutarate dehydrogenase, E2 component, dihydrolipoamide succinyltransferase [Enemella dayhoffiae]|uniref:Dihydrolipoamide acetyltransferase component of pyruvate dehydrogenase complex n=1 Tax=Enemella dayhoffiae TaxID=2016507 RepID=A0A255GTL0_9ACTN|nr:2-oxoglutarate dehydrogenase, E2 component, dihydrolipoamide succinyltransferase [Enemella dayhoffiae]OYO18036.1 2-oxoglutarate dehydrogenase, E2 component, dihydrolipoamide succinyltransferase [Enemella dayhoffiae]